MKALLRGSLATLVGSVALLVAPAAFALGEPCFNDVDCPGGGAVCGGDVCNWNKMSPMMTTAKPYYCNPAGTDAKGSDGWCTSTNGDADCKCMGAGAKCVGVHCSFTKASDAPAGTGGTGAGGTSAGGSTSTAGTATTPTAGTATTPTAGTASTPASSDDGGGCSVSAPGNTAGGIAVALGMVGLGLAFARRRR